MLAYQSGKVKKREVFHPVVIKLGGEAYALTCPLITKADGTKFGKTESGNVWLDSHYTSPYKFYQFWLNVSDEDAERYIKIFTELTREEVEALVAEQAEDPGRRPLQKRLAKEVTVMVHSLEDYEAAVEASQILFSNKAGELLHSIDEQTLLDIFEGVDRYEIEQQIRTGRKIYISHLLLVYGQTVLLREFSQFTLARKYRGIVGKQVGKFYRTVKYATVDFIPVYALKYVKQPGAYSCRAPFK